MQVIMRAYDVKAFQVVGPAWLKDEKYEILANMPSGTTNEIFLLMLRSLLAERWNLKLHHEPGEFPVYELGVGKNGIKMAPSEEPTRGLAARRIPGGVELESKAADMPALAFVLEMWLDKPSPDPLFSAISVLDKTGLTGRYAYKVSFATNLINDKTEFSPPDVRSALADLGLTLQKKKAQFDVLVIDSISKRPTEN